MITRWSWVVVFVAGMAAMTVAVSDSKVVQQVAAVVFFVAAVADLCLVVAYEAVTKRARRQRWDLFVHDWYGRPKTGH